MGPAGTGKTYLAVAQAVSQLITGSVDRLILSRPAVEAGERLGFLPGDMKEKVDPYLRPLYDALYDMLPTEQVERRIASGEIEIAPIAFMRGRTLNDAFIILDEAQNTTPLQMKMFLTRFGMRSRMVICGDPDQIDLARSRASRASPTRSRKLEGIKGIATVRFTAADVVRHPLVGRIVEAYEGPGRMMLEIALEADEEWDSSRPWDALVRKAAEAAIAESAFPAARDVRSAGRTLGPPDRRRAGPRAQRRMARQGQADQRPVLPDGRRIDDLRPGKCCRTRTVARRHHPRPRRLRGRSGGKRRAVSNSMRPTCWSTARSTCSATIIIDDADAADMEAREVRALARLGIANPYEVAA